MDRLGAARSSAKAERHESECEWQWRSDADTLNYGRLVEETR